MNVILVGFLHIMNVCLFMLLFTRVLFISKQSANMRLRIRQDFKYVSRNSPCKCLIIITCCMDIGTEM